MKEQQFIATIADIIGKEYIGDDCAYLKDLDIVITQDSLVEDIHFKRDWASPYQLGYKSVVVNISDILASGADPKYVTIALSLPNSIENDFISEFYRGAQKGLYGASIVGGDITGSSDKIMISVAVIGSTKKRNISSRKNARPGYKIITSGYFGSSAAGLQELINGGSNKKLILSHLEPSLNFNLSKWISTNIKEAYAMMDTSDGLADALFKIGEASHVKMSVDYNKIRHLHDISEYQVLFGGEDYNLIAAIPEKYCSLLNNIEIIGSVYPYDGNILSINNKIYNDYSQLRVFNHFRRNNA